MAFNFKSVLKPDASIMAAIATAALVYGVYQLDVGNVSVAAASDANHPALETSRKKAGYTSLILVAGLTLITKDGNIGTIGFGSIVAMEIHYRQAIMADPATGKIVAPSLSSYQPAENVIPIDQQGSVGTGSY